MAIFSCATKTHVKTLFLDNVTYNLIRNGIKNFPTEKWISIQQHTFQFSSSLFTELYFSCQNKILIPKLLSFGVLNQALQELQHLLSPHNRELSINPLNIGKYYNLPLLKCIISPNHALFAVKILIITNRRRIKTFKIIPITFRKQTQLCAFDLVTQVIAFNNSTKKSTD